MKVAIMQPYLFPYIGYFQLLNRVDKFVLYDDANYINRGWINRNRILLNGKAKMITLPLNGASQNKLINEISIHNGKREKKKFLKTIRHAYTNSPYYNQVFPLIEEIMSNDEENIAKFIEYSLKRIGDYLDYNTDFIISSELGKNNSLKGEDKILDICQLLKADIYINPIGGRDLYSKDRFIGEGIELYFIQTNKIRYSQNNENFIPNLSIIDTLMFNSKNKVKDFLEGYKLV
ncbi:WbqC family protein [Orenia marismortui]|uniref:WbqC-like protein n=1 Tax=Orenia marismortui TaxID=46469 RepID=A0A4R8HHN4_9FIRM|nr:WbqC family protein [Orenia marismortui]TDX58918.1 WbqC-like protein [Orenia marismortui]